MGEAYYLILQGLIARGFRSAARAGAPAQGQISPHRSAPFLLSDFFMTRTVHIIGAGLAGLSAAIKLTGRGDNVVVHEATAFAGGRCRSYHDAFVGMTIDNGNHLLLSGNRAALAYLREIGGTDRLAGPEHAEFPFVDLKSNARWTLRFDDGRIPFWIFDRQAAGAGHRPARLSVAGAAVMGGVRARPSGKIISLRGRAL